ncbi:MAG: winged helix-turn-helix domain-containing protein [Paracoccaceae bacterium]
MTDPAKPAPILRLRIHLSEGDWMGPGKADLLAGIAGTGSIAAAARQMGMSYKRAWMLVEVTNAMFAEPLVIAARGGSGHGGASLTPAGERALAIYRGMQAKAEAALAAELAEMGAMGADPAAKAKRGG